VNFPDKISKNTQISDFVRISSVGAELFHANGQKNRRTDGHDETNSRFSNAPKNSHSRYQIMRPSRTSTKHVLGVTAVRTTNVTISDTTFPV